MLQWSIMSRSLFVFKIIFSVQKQQNLKNQKKILNSRLCQHKKSVDFTRITPPLTQTVMEIKRPRHRTMQQFQTQLHAPTNYYPIKIVLQFQSQFDQKLWLKQPIQKYKAPPSEEIKK